MDRNKTVVTWGEHSHKRSKNMDTSALQKEVDDLKEEEERLNVCLKAVTESMASNLQSDSYIYGENIVTALENTGIVGGRSFAISYPYMMAPAHDFGRRTGKIGLTNRQHYIGREKPDTSLIIKCQKRKNHKIQISRMLGLWDDADGAKTYLDDLGDLPDESTPIPIMEFY